MRRSGATSLLLAVGLLLAAPATTTSAASTTGEDTEVTSATDGTSSDITWGIAPADANGAPDGRVSVRTTLDPGATLTDQVVVTNYSDFDLTFDLLASDGVTGEDGSFDILSAQETPADSGAWIDIAPSVEVPALTSTAVPFTITVPPDATPGDHPAGITAALSQENPAVEGTNVQFEARVGVRLHLRVAGDLLPVLTVSDLSTTFDAGINPFAPGLLTTSYTVTNTGNVRLGSVQEVLTTGLLGYRVHSGAGDLALEQREILPGDSVVISTQQRAWPMGSLATTLTAQSLIVGEDEVDATQLVAVVAETSVVALPIPQVAFLIIVALGVYLLWRLRSRRQRRISSALERAREEGRREAAADRPESVTAN